MFINEIHLFHGTSFENYLSIKENGFSNCKRVIWNCSDEEKTYFYEMERLCKTEGIDCDEQGKIEFCLERANENAQITASIEKNPYNKTVVFEFITEAEYLEDYMEGDDSCENMDEKAVCIDSLVLNDLLRKRKAILITHFFRFLPKLSLFYLACVFSNPYFQDSINQLQYEEIEFIKEIIRGHIFVDEIFSYQEELWAEEIILN